LYARNKTGKVKSRKKEDNTPHDKAREMQLWLQTRSHDINAQEITKTATTGTEAQVNFEEVKDFTAQREVPMTGCCVHNGQRKAGQQIRHWKETKLPVASRQSNNMIRERNAKTKSQKCNMNHGRKKVKESKQL